MPMNEPPFIVGKPVTGEYFINREEELAKVTALLSGVVSGKINNIIILGLRRTGKTSILLNVTDRLPDKTVPVIYDCLGTSTKSMFARQFIDAVLDAYVRVSGDKAYKEKLLSIIQKGLDWAEERISEFEVGLAEYVRFRIKLREPKVNEDELLQSALKYPDNLARSKQVTFAIMMDEFQELLKWSEDFLKMLRTIVQSQKQVTYAFTGSAPTMIRDLVYKQRSPFYKQLTEIQVKRLAEEPIRKFVKSRFSKVKLNISTTALDRFVHHSGGFPDYVQRLGLNLYLRSLSKKDWQTIEEPDVEDCYEEMLTQLDGEFTTYFVTFSDFEKDTLIALAKGNNSPSSIATEIRKPLSSIPQILIRLLNADVAEKYKEASYRIADPVFSDWLARRYAGLSL
jgi:AAA+ ATPase superfamily predicted ATPase